MSDPLTRATEAAVSILCQELERVDGDFREIDFTALHELWIGMLTAEELQAFEDYVETAGPITASMLVTGARPTTVEGLTIN
jgi:hypothetical protein